MGGGSRVGVGTPVVLAPGDAAGVEGGDVFFFDWVVAGRWLGDGENFFQVAIFAVVELKRIAGRGRRHDVREAAQVGRRDAHPERGRGLVERK